MDNLCTKFNWIIKINQSLTCNRHRRWYKCNQQFQSTTSQTPVQTTSTIWHLCLCPASTRLAWDRFMPAIKSLQPMTRARLGYVLSFHSNLSLLRFKAAQYSTDHQCNNSHLPNAATYSQWTQSTLLRWWGWCDRASTVACIILKPFYCVTHALCIFPVLDREEPSSRSNHFFSFAWINHTFIYFTQPSYSLLHTDVQ